MEPLFTIEQITSKDNLGQSDVYTDLNSSTFGPAPILKPFGMTNPGDAQSYKTVNVVNDFPWTSAPPLQNQDMYNARYDIPVLDLREQSVQLNPSFNNLARNLFIAGDNVTMLASVFQNLPGPVKMGMAAYIAGKAGAVIGPGAAAVSALAGATLTGIAPGFVDRAVDTIADTVENAVDNVKDPLDPSVKRTFNSVKPYDLAGMMSFNDYNQYLAPYQDIYTTKDTGWRYKIPYMEDQQRVNRSGWSKTPVAGGAIAETARDLALAASSLVTPGVYIDQGKNFVYEGNEKQYTVSFPLMNTHSQEHIMRNWQLLFLLTYQNRPNRIDRVQLTPPKIYEAMIPGVWWCRHAYISNLSVEFVGNRRKMSLMIPLQQGEVVGFSNTTEGMEKEIAYAEKFKDSEFVSTIQNRDGQEIGARYRRPSATLPVTTIIPDAYQVTITLTELVPESQNTMFAAIHKPNTITTSPLDQGGLQSGINLNKPAKSTNQSKNQPPGSSSLHPNGHNARHYGFGSSQ